jgi:D-beta-D-heptose 7-phosphate kinase/D-beta-D-heptose 1-phosphate adenosyltransferase
MPKNLAKFVDQFKGKKIAVVGDLMLDHFIFGDIDRISPEAPVPVLLAKADTMVPGGAGNVATNLAALGALPIIFAVVGTDEAAPKLLSELKKRGVLTEGIVTDPGRPTTQKTRVVARNQQLVRIDREKTDYIDQSTEKKLLAVFAKFIKKVDGVAISDYAKGAVTENLAREIIALANKYKKPVIVDTKPKHANFFKNFTLIKTNHKEAVGISGVDDIKTAGKKIQKMMNCDVLVTRGAEGMALFAGGALEHFPTQAREVYDVVGAGDTVVAALLPALASGASLREATIIANYAAGIVVGKAGTATVGPEELKESLQ